MISKKSVINKFYLKKISMKRSNPYSKMPHDFTCADSRRAPLMFAAVWLLILWPDTADACSPLLPYLFAVVFPYSISNSVLGLFAGVAGKCILFAFFVRQLNWLKAAGLMLGANLITSLFGLILIGVLRIPLALALFPLVCGVAVLPSKSLHKRLGDQLPDWFSRPVIAAVLFVALVANAALFSAADSVSLNSGGYWFLKLGYIYIGLAIGIGFTTLWEEWLVFSFAKADQNTNFLSSVVRTNLYTFLVLALIGAAYALPQRLSHPRFLF